MYERVPCSVRGVAGAARGEVRAALRPAGLGWWKNKNSIDFRSRINSHAYNFLLNLLIFLLLHSGFLFKTHSFVPLTVSNCIKRSLSHSWSYQEQIKAFINLHWLLPGPLTGAFPVPCAGCGRPAALPKPSELLPAARNRILSRPPLGFSRRKSQPRLKGWGRAAGAERVPPAPRRGGGEILEPPGKRGRPPGGEHRAPTVLAAPSAPLGSPSQIPKGEGWGGH